MVLAGRRINDAMGSWAAEQLVLAMARKGLSLQGAKVAVLGLSFKENCPDLRNTRVVDVVRGLEGFGLQVEVIDWAELEGLPPVPQGAPAGTSRSASCRHRGSPRSKPRTGCSPNPKLQLPIRQPALAASVTAVCPAYAGATVSPAH